MSFGLFLIFADLKERLNYKFGDTPASFWMKFESFLEVFTDIFFCHNLAPEHRCPQQQLLGPHEEVSPEDAPARESQLAAVSHAAGDPSAEAAKADM